MKVRGRPKKDISRGYHISVRLNSDEIDMLSEICSEKEITMAEVVRTALEMYYKVYLYHD